MVSDNSNKINGMQFVNTVNNSLDKRDLEGIQRLKNITTSSECELKVSPEKNDINESQAPFLEENLILNLDTKNPFCDYRFVLIDASSDESEGINYNSGNGERMWEKSFSIPQKFFDIKDRILVFIDSGLYNARYSAVSLKRVKVNIYKKSNDNTSLLFTRTTNKSYGDKISVPLAEIMTEPGKDNEITIEVIAYKYKGGDTPYVYVGPAFCEFKDYSYLTANRLFSEGVL